MKFSLFAHIERYDDSVSHKQLLDELTEFTLMAEAGGMETIWIGDRLPRRHGWHAGRSTVVVVGTSFIWHCRPAIFIGTGRR